MKKVREDLPIRAAAEDRTKPPRGAVDQIVAVVKREILMMMLS
jgi:hypothetical protein